MSEMRLFGWYVEQWAIVCGWFNESPATLQDFRLLRNRWRERFPGEPQETSLVGVKMPRDWKAAFSGLESVFKELDESRVMRL